MAHLLQVQEAVPAQVRGLEQLHCNRVGPPLGLSLSPSALPKPLQGLPTQPVWGAALSPPEWGLGWGLPSGAGCLLPRELGAYRPHLGIFLGESEKASPQMTGTRRAEDAGAWSQDQCTGNAGQAVWPGPGPWGGGHWSGPSPHPCRRLAFQPQAHQRLLCRRPLGTALYGTHWAHSPAAWLGEVSRDEGSVRALEEGPGLLSPLTPHAQGFPEFCSHANRPEAAGGQGWA